MSTPEYPGPYPYPDQSYPVSTATYPPLGAGADLPPAPPPGYPSAPAPKKAPGAAGAIAGVLVGAAVVALVAGAVGGAVGYTVARETLPGDAVAVAAAGASGAAGDVPALVAGSVAEIASQVQPSVVQLIVAGEQGEGSGSGFVISRDGYIITNNHVAGVAGPGGDIEVQFADGSKADGKFIGGSPGYDVAVVKVDRRGLDRVAIGSSSDLKVGESVIAVGSPLGLAGTVTTGIVSALNRPVTAGGEGETSFINAIQTDAAINPGNSGGPLLNANGEVIGVNSAIASMGAMGGQVGSIGLGFAIPIDVAKRIADEIIATGKSTTPIIGVQLDMEFTGDGARIAEITPGGPADEAGLEAGDTIIAVNDRPLVDGTELVVTVRSQNPGDTVSLTVERGGQTLTIPVTLEANSD